MGCSRASAGGGCFQRECSRSGSPTPCFHGGARARHTSYRSRRCSRRCSNEAATEEVLMLDTVTRRFADRRAAGRELAECLSPFAGEDPVVLGLARGGVPVAYEVAKALGAPLDVLVVRKIGAPGNPEYGIGAIAEGDVRVLSQAAMRDLLVSVDELEAAVARARAEIDTRVQRYRGGRPPLEVNERTVIVVDDGLATGGTARAALRAVRAHGPRRLVLAVPVGAPETVESLREEADDVVCV